MSVANLLERTNQNVLDVAKHFVVIERASEDMQRLAAEDGAAIAGPIAKILSIFLNTHITCYPKSIGEFTKFVGREFGTLVDEKILEKIAHPSNFLDNSKQIEVAVEDIDVLKGKKKDKLEYQFSLNGQSKVAASNKKGGSDGKRLFLDCLETDRLEITVFKYGQEGIRFLGQATLPMSEVFSLRSHLLVVTNGEARVGTLAMQSQIIFRDADYAKDRVKSILFQAMAHSIASTLGIEGTLDSPLIPNHSTVSSECGIRITQAGGADRKMSTSLFLEDVPCPIDSQEAVELHPRTLPGCTIRIECRESKSNASSPEKKLSAPDSLFSLVGRNVSPARTTGTWAGSRGVFQESFSIYDIPLRSAKTIEFQETKWTIEWVPLAGTDVELADVEQVLIHRSLDQIPRKDWEHWTGSLVPKEYQIENLLQMFHNLEEQAQVKDQCLLQAHEDRWFNFNLIFEIVQRSGDNLPMKARSALIKTIAHFLASINFEECIPTHSITGSLKCVEHLARVGNASKSFAHTYVKEYTARIITQFFTLSIEDLRDVLVKYAVPVLEIQTKEPNSIMDMLWAKLSSQCILDCCVSQLESWSELEQSSGQTTFEMFRIMRKLNVHEPALEPRIFKVFKPCLSSWVGTVESKGLEQVDKVLHFERIRHASQDWSTFCKDDFEWFEGARDVDGILTTCLNTWDELDWPDMEIQSAFGLDLVKRLCKIFNHYIQVFFGIVFADRLFDRHEFVIIMFTLSSWGEYLSKINEKLNCMMQATDVSTFGRRVLQNMEQLKSTLAQAQFQISEKAIKFQEEFFVGEKVILESFGKNRNLFNERHNEDCLLGYINKELKFFNDYLKFDTEMVTKAYNRSICQRYFNLAEEIFHEQFVKLKIKSKLKGDTEVFKPYLHALEELRAFQKDLGIIPCPALADVHREVTANFAQTWKLLFKHIRAVFDTLQQNPPNPNGTLKFNVAKMRSEAGVTVTLSLQSLTEIPSRNPEDWTFGSFHSELPNSRLVVSVPTFGTESNPLKEGTDVYVEMKDILFGFNETAKSSFQFAIESNKSHDPDCIDAHGFILIELFDHSKMKTHKYFQGMILLPLAEIQDDTTVEVVKPFQMMPQMAMSHLQSLKARRDWAAKQYLKRHDHRCRSDKKIFELLPSEVQWLDTLDYE